MEPEKVFTSGESGVASRPIELSRPWYDQRELDRVAKALASRTSGDGPFCRAVERRLEASTGSPRVLLTTSCTHALELALLALGIGPGSEVICPSFTFVSTANAILRVGARPVLADIEPVHLGLDPRDAERRITTRTAALLPVHYGGVAADMDALLDLARRRGLRVVEDAAQGIDADLGGRALGTLGDAGCLSFHETKNVACGEGGALLVRDPEVAARAEIIREKGTNRGAFLRGEVDKYTWVAEGSSYVLSDVLAAILDAQLDKIGEIRARRERIAERYRDELRGWADAHGVRLPAASAGRRTNHHVFGLLFGDEATRDRCLASVRARGVLATFHYVPLHSSPHGRAFAGSGGFTVSDMVARTLLRLPLHPGMGDADVDRVVDALLASLG